MYVISKHTFVVHNPNSPARERLLVKLSPDTQFVPDWVRDTDYFKLATKGGTLLEVVPVKAPEEAAPVPESALGLEGGNKPAGGKTTDDGKKAEDNKSNEDEKQAPGDNKAAGNKSGK